MPGASGSPLFSGHAWLRTLLSERNRSPLCAVEIDARIEQFLCRKVAVLVLDMCGFSRITAEHGIIHFLALLRRMEEAACPAVAANGGLVIKQEADNLFAAFDSPRQALDAALDILRAVEVMNAAQPCGPAMQVCAGIGYGDTLVIEGEDMFGHEMNLACKLGEDIAGSMEILLTAAAHASLADDVCRWEAASARIGGQELTHYRLCTVSR